MCVTANIESSKAQRSKCMMQALAYACIRVHTHTIQLSIRSRQRRRSLTISSSRVCSLYAATAAAVSLSVLLSACASPRTRTSNARVSSPTFAHALQQAAGRAAPTVRACQGLPHGAGQPVTARLGTCRPLPCTQGHYTTLGA